MIAVIKPSATESQRNNLVEWIRGQGIDVHISEGHDYTVIGLIGDTAKIDMDLIESLDIVDSVKRVTEPFKQCSRKFHPDDTVIDVGGVKLGGRTLLCRIKRADHSCGKVGMRIRCRVSSRRRVQTENISV